MSTGIDYGRGMCNIDHATGFRYGVLQVNRYEFVCGEIIDKGRDLDYANWREDLISGVKNALESAILEVVSYLAGVVTDDRAALSDKRFELHYAYLQTTMGGAVISGARQYHHKDLVLDDLSDLEDLLDYCSLPLLSDSESERVEKLEELIVDAQRWDAAEVRDWVSEFIDDCDIEFESNGDFPTIGHEGEEYTWVTNSHGNLMVIKSPWVVACRYCSLCYPGAGDLETPDRQGIWAYGLGPEWFSDSENLERWQLRRHSDEPSIARGVQFNRDLPMVRFRRRV